MAFEIIEIDGLRIDPQTKRLPVEIKSEAHVINGEQHTGILDDGQIPVSIMRTALHQSDPHTMSINGRNVAADGAKLDTIESGAQVNNLSNAQAQDLVSGLHVNWHNHDAFYFRKTELQSSGMSQVHWDNLTNKPSTFVPSAHNHNDVYYTKALLDGGQLDSRYYTESEIDAMIQAASAGIEGAVDTYDLLPSSGLTTGMIYIVRQTSEAYEEGFYRWSGTTWEFLVNNTGVETHNGLNGINDGDYKHLTAVQLSELTGGVSTSLHNHDSLYFTESEVTALLSNKANTLHNHNDVYYTKALLDGGQLDSRYYTMSNLQGSGTAQVHWDNLSNKPTTFPASTHNHDSLYYLKTELDAGQLDARYYSELEIDTKLAQKANTAHSHNDVYYTETEINAFLSQKSDLMHNHDSAYYTKTNLQASGAAQVHWDNLTNKPTTFSPSAHMHDDRYYTETEIATLLSQKSDLTHNHDSAYYTKTNLQTSGFSQVHWDNITNKPTFGGNNWIQSVLVRYSGAALPTSGYASGDRIIWTLDQAVYQYNGTIWTIYTPTSGDAVMVKNDGDSKPAQYWYNGTTWIKIADPDYADHGSLSGLADDDHAQYLNASRHSAIISNPHSTTLTQVIATDTSITWGLAQLNTLLNGSDIVLHTHDSRYYTKAQSDESYAVVSHLHDERYYQIGEVTVATISANDPNTDVTASELETLTNGSNADGLHTHTFTGGGDSTLDEAYGTWGEGRTIAVDAGPVNLEASGGFAPIRLAPVDYTPTQWLSGGELCFKDNELFVRDSLRAKWLSVSTVNFSSGTASSTANGYMYVHNSIQMNSSLGFCMPFNGTIVGLSISNQNCNASGNLLVRNWGDEITSMWFSGYATSTMNLNTDFSKDDVLQLYISANGNGRPNKPIVNLIVKKRI